MGYINHNAIVVTAWDEERIKAAHTKAKEIFSESCSDLVKSVSNNYVSFFVAPDGSKEGWLQSGVGDRKRQEFDEWLRSENHWLDAVEIHYGGDEPDLKGIKIIGELPDQLDE